MSGDLTPVQEMFLSKINVTHKALWGLNVRGPKYNSLVRILRVDVSALGRTHRNWNEATQEPDGMYPEYEDQPRGSKPPKIAAEDLTHIEKLIEDLVYWLKKARLEKPTMQSFRHYEEFSNRFFDLTTFHSTFNSRAGEIDVDLDD